MNSTKVSKGFSRRPARSIGQRPTNLHSAQLSSLLAQVPPLNTLSLIEEKENSRLKTACFPLQTAVGQRNPLLEASMTEDLQVVAQLPPIDESLIVFKMVNLTRSRLFGSQKTLIVDLDGTLVCGVDADQSGAMRLDIGWIVARPFAREFLREASKVFEIVVFTAATKNYADAVIDFLDPDGEYVQHRLYRNDCISWKGVFVKDLRILNRKPEDILIVDDNIASFAFQLDNGVPVVSWQGEKNDEELRGVLDYVQTLVTVEDVRPVNKQKFQLTRG